MTMRVYHYPACSTCKKALKYLEATGHKFTLVDIVKSPPTVSEISTVLKAVGGEIRTLFNTSGELYREMGLKDTLASLSEFDAIELLSRHGKLIKRPFVCGIGVGLVGFKEDQWKAVFER